MFEFRGKLKFNKSTFAMIAFLISYYYLTNFVFLDIKYLTDGEYTALFYLNGLLCIFFSTGSENEKLSFMDDDNEFYKSKSEIKVGFYLAAIAFALWHICYEEIVQAVHFNSTTAIAVLSHFNQRWSLNYTRCSI